MFLPLRTKNPPERLPLITISLIAVNLVVYACTTYDFMDAKDSVVRDWGLSGQNFDFIHMVSSMFLHANLLHILGNMWFLYLFGFAVEGRLGHVRYLGLYFVAGFAGDLLDFVIRGQYSPDVQSIGASGAIMGVVGAAMYLFPFSTVSVFWFWWYRIGISDWPLWGVGLYYLGFDLLGAFVGSDGVGHLAHLGGAATGFLLAFALLGRRDNKAASEAKATFAEIGDLSLLSAVELEAYAKSQPDSTLVALNWIYRSLIGKGPTDECVKHFLGMLPKVINEQPPESVGFVLEGLLARGTPIPPQYLILAANRFETAGNSLTSFRLYEAALTTRALGEQDWQAAVFRSGLIAETAMGNVTLAAARYNEVLQRDPYGPFADQARTRLANLQRNARV